MNCIAENVQKSTQPTVRLNVAKEYDKVREEAILRNCSKKEVDLTSESMCLEIGLLTSGIIYHNVV